MKPHYLLLAALLLPSLGACSGRLDPQEADKAALTAAELYQEEFSARAPRLDGQRLQQAMDARIEALDPKAPQPTLLPDYLSSKSPTFVTSEGPDEDMDAVLALCEALPTHDVGLDAYPCQALNEQMKAFEQGEADYKGALAKSSLNQEHVDRLKQHLMTLEGEALRQEDGSIEDDTLVAVMFGQKSFETPLPHIDQELQGLERLVKTQAARLAELEELAHVIVLRFVWDQRGAHADDQWRRWEDHRTWLDELATREEARTKEPDEHLRWQPPEGWPQSAEVAQARVMQGFMARLGQEPTAAVIKAATPAGDQYGRLLAALARYRAIEAAGGFKPIDAPALTRLRGKKPSPALAALRARLVQEGYEAPVSDDAGQMDSGLREALKAFQRAHQVRDKGKLTKATMAALKITAAEKVTRLRLALRHVRRAMPRDEDHLYVNAPDFHGELWVKGERQHRFRVVVGDRKRKRRRGEGLVYVNATPEVAALIDRVVYNPYWNVPKRIFKREIMRGKEDLEEDERHTMLRNKGFQVMGAGTKYEWVRQPPGPGNALGQVKIIFPNPHEIYLHDTQSKSLFYRPVRAFSHGCVRIHKPLDLARLILERDGSFNERRVARLVRNYDNQAFFLKEKLPIFVDYITVRVADDGHVHFLTDIYGRDAERLDALTASADAGKR